MWEIYDELIAAVPPDLSVGECVMGLHWSLIRSQAVGMALTPSGQEITLGAGGGPFSSALSGPIAGMSVRKLAGFVKSWNPSEATLGMAAINSVLNTAQQVEKLTGQPLTEQKQVSVFSYFTDHVRGKKVAVVGRFPDLDEMARICQLSVIERRPRPGDYPDPACEYILPQQDCIFITATALINKTLPRLLELSRNALTVLVGPSTPLTPTMFEHGVDFLAGAIVVDAPAVWQAAQEGAARGVFDHGVQMVKVSKADWQHNQRQHR